MSFFNVNGFGSSWLAPLLLLLQCAANTAAQQVTFNSQPLESDQDLASEMVDGLDRFLLRKLDASQARREDFWATHLKDNPAAIRDSRTTLKSMLGMTEQRIPIQFAYERSWYPWLRMRSDGPLKDVSIEPIAWSVLPDPTPGRESLSSIHGEGLILEKKNTKTIGTLIAIPDAGIPPEGLLGFRETAKSETWALGLAQAGYRVIIPAILSRKLVDGRRKNTLDQREYLHRSAYELGKTLTGYELHKILSLVDTYGFFEGPLIVAGQGEGGRLALLAAALSTEIDATVMVGSFGPRQQLWEEPLDRNVFGQLNQFDDSDLARLVAPRKLIIGNFGYPELEISGNGGRAPSRITTPEQATFQEELDQAKSHFSDSSQCIVAKSWQHLFDALPAGPNFVSQKGSFKNPDELDEFVNEREKRLFLEIERHNQSLLHESTAVRKKFLNDLDYSAVEAYKQSAEKYRKIFRTEIVGAFEDPLLPANPRSRKSWETDKWIGHEVQLDVFPDVFAYGVLLLPKDLKPGEKRPVVVCQHGLEGRPTDTFQGDHRAYHDFASKLCERGFIIFAPQNPYIFGDRFRTLQRKANLLGKTLFSLIVPQHQQITDWLQTLEFVAPNRIAFYGLSYGGKSAMRIPALVDDYCLSICSADFNEWVLKNASTRHDFSYVWTGEYEIFEWNLGQTFNYFEMAALICPRPFMVERGHFDGVGRDEWVAFEYAKVRHLYAAQLQISDHTEIEWFRGPHTINGKGTFDFLHRHLRFRSPAVSR
ncbi:MAG: hypothetical protein VXZ82_13440 [Planctomycetota bacterium]|nr:hypothetical protein [Planctomycetota bacterium]